MEVFLPKICQSLVYLNHTGNERAAWPLFVLLSLNSFTFFFLLWFFSFFFSFKSPAAMWTILLELCIRVCCCLRSSTAEPSAWKSLFSPTPLLLSGQVPWLKWKSKKYSVCLKNNFGVILIPLSRYCISVSPVELCRRREPAWLGRAALWDPDCRLPQSVCSRLGNSLQQWAVSHRGPPPQQQALGNSVWRRCSDSCCGEGQQSHKNTPARLVGVSLANVFTVSLP